MNKLLILGLCAVVATAAHAQEKKKYPEPAPMKPEMTEDWLPQPEIVIPGDIVTNSAPSDAIVLFDGSNLDAWMSKATKGPADWYVHDGVVTVDKTKSDIQTRQNFGSFQLHLEWCVPENITGSSQHRGNSGGFLQGLYEIQILDSYNNETYSNGQAGSVYKQTRPLVNAMRKPGEWNVYDIIYNAPVFNSDGTYRVNPTVTLLHNGVLVLNNAIILGRTKWIGNPDVVPHSDGPIILQMHGDASEPISFRNIWIREL